MEGAVAQLVEQWTENPCVAGSIPAHTTLKAATNVVAFFILDCVMLKMFFLLSLFLFGCLAAEAQQFAGLWKGSFSTRWENMKNVFAIEIKLKADGSYDIYSYSGFPENCGFVSDTAFVCKMHYKLRGNHKIDLEEYERVLPKTLSANTFQRMVLKYSKTGEQEKLYGPWYYADENLGIIEGYVNLVKQPANNAPVK